uniref:RNA polymerase alpha subunit n=1 Tax=Gymnochlora stellata TaxID=67809 RepID=A0A140JZH5_GYMST|nr:RNA polymerase alpha subunit [Gymnochlora stellata]BAU62502.1 RNA polymerase alpha subunit [Gymnochlora stellata]
MEYKIFSCIESRVKNSRSYYSRFQLGPFIGDKALIYSNTLRRTLLSDMNNISIIGISIVGVNHEYSSISGVKDSVLDILLNLKQLVFCKGDSMKENMYYFSYLREKGPKIIKSCNLILPNTIRCVDKDQYIASLSFNGSLIMKIKLFNKFTNDNFFYSNFNWNSLLAHYTSFTLKSTEFVMFIDSNLCCVNKVNYFISSLDYLEDYSNFILLELWTNGSLSPRSVLQHSIQNIIQLFSSLYDNSINKIYLNRSFSYLDNYMTNLANRQLFIEKNFYNFCLNKNYNHYLSLNNTNFESYDIKDFNISVYSKFLLKRYGIINTKDLNKIKKKLLNRQFGFSSKYLRENTIVFAFNIKSENE